MINPKIIAYYLPAFHEIDENNKWYGKGFTEWDNNKRAKSLFYQHYQPRVPLNEYYYDLSNNEVLVEQMNLAKKYGIYGFCFYHYWFDESGRKILEKPAETMLKMKTATIPYCFAWTNESWRRTWHEGSGDSELLIEQKYGDEKDWENHFNYLLPFFKDTMYLKNENRPVFLVYKLENIKNSQRFIDYFNKRAKDNGFDGIYFVRMLTNSNCLNCKIETNASVDFEPNYMFGSRSRDTIAYWRLKLGISRKTNGRILNKVNYNQFYHSIINKKKNENEFYGCVTDWDNTPRKGKNGVILDKVSPKAFRENFSQIYNISKNKNKKYIFIFAWNEWGEGGYLEPDQKYEFAYLDAIHQCINNSH